MPSEGVSALWHIEIPELDGMIHGAGDQEISSFVEITLPNWLTMLSECVGTACIDEVPNLYIAIS